MGAVSKVMMTEPVVESAAQAKDEGVEVEDGDSLNVGPLPSFMLGSFQLETTENFDEFMKELGVNWLTRNIGNNLYPVQKIWQRDGDIHIDTETSFRSTFTDFKLDKTWQETTADGRITQTTATLEERSLKKVQVPDPSTGYHTTVELREFSEDGNEMKMTLSIPDKPDATSIRIYKRMN